MIFYFLLLNFDFMSRIIAIDYGLKRTGLAVTDPLKIIATGLTTVESKQLIPFLKKYFSEEQIELIIIGEPKNWDDTDTHATPLVHHAIKELEKSIIEYRKFSYYEEILEKESDKLETEERYQQHIEIPINK